MNSTQPVLAFPSPSPSKGEGALPAKGQGGDHPWPWWPLNQRRSPYRAYLIVADPYRRLLAAIICQAVIDVVNPQKGAFKPSDHDRHTSQQFLLQHRQTLAEFDIPWRKINFLVERLSDCQEAPHAS